MEATTARAGAGMGMQQRVAQPSPSGAQSRPRRATPAPGAAPRSVGNLGDSSFSSSPSRVMSSRNVRLDVAPSPPPAQITAANESAFAAILQRLAAAEAEREEDRRRLAEFTSALAEERRLAELRAFELAQERQSVGQTLSGLRAALALTEQRLRQFEERGRAAPPPGYPCDLRQFEEQGRPVPPPGYPGGPCQFEERGRSVPPPGYPGGTRQFEDAQCRPPGILVTRASLRSEDAQCRPPVMGYTRLVACVRLRQ